MRYIPALDGIRAVAVVLTIAAHTQVVGFGGGFLGVDMFFVLSGYLITTLLLQEREGSGQINFLHFYIRRALRLYPVLLLFLFLYLLVFHAYQFKNDFIISALYLSDYALALGYMKLSSPLAHTWSLAIEEHFYILWPLLVAGLHRFCAPKKIIAVLGVAYLATSAWKFGSVFLLGETVEQVCFRFDTRVSGLILGGLLAACLFYKHKIPRATLGMALSGAALLVSIYLVNDMKGEICTSPIAELFTFFTICRITENENWPVIRWLSARPVVFVGRVSYGMYLFHFPIAMYLVWQKNIDGLPAFAMTLAVTFAVSVYSYFTVELLARKWARKYRTGGKKISGRLVT